MSSVCVTNEAESVPAARAADDRDPAPVFVAALVPKSIVVCCIIGIISCVPDNGVDLTFLVAAFDGKIGELGPDCH